MKVRLLDQSLDDPTWDEFLMTLPTGHHLQSTPWGQLKAKFGWQVIRIQVEEGEAVVGGAQILVRRLPVWGKIGYISKGPVVLSQREDVMEAVFDRIQEVAEKSRCLILSIQPPADEPLYMTPIQSRALTLSAFYVVPPTTVLVDLLQDEDEILAQMKQKTRYNIRLAARKDVTIREGDEADLSLFHRFMQITGARSEYVYYDLDYYQEAWRQFAPQDMMKLWIAYYQDEPLAAIIAIAFGQWAVYKWGGASDAHRNRMPNYLLQWTAMRWSKKKGCHYYDLGGITPASVAEALKQGQKPHDMDGKGASLARFKLGFGELVTFPEAYNDYYGIRPKWLMRKATSYAGQLETLRAMVLGGSNIWKQKATTLKGDLVARDSPQANLEREER